MVDSKKPTTNYQLPTTRPALLAIVGTTASGKSDLAMKVAKELNGEIISADSWTVYRGFDIGTGKPSPADRKAVKHYLIDVREASQGFNAPAFKEMADKAVDDIQKRGKLPILAGGTGLYTDSVLYNFGFLDNSSPEERAELDAMSLSELLEIARLQKIDLTGIDTRNKRRLIRAIEAKGAKPTKSRLRQNTLIIGLQLKPEVLRERIEQRIDSMLAAGLEQEVKQLSDKYGWDSEPMKGIGYRAFRDYIEGQDSLEEAKQKFIKGDLNLAKRQRTWFKRNADIHWFGSAEQAYDFVTKQLKASRT